MQNEMQNLVSEFYKVECVDVFFELLSPELNLDGVVFFFRQTIPIVVDAIEKHFQPVEAALKRVGAVSALDGPVANVLRKSYQSNWRQIHAQCLPLQFSEGVMQDVQKHLSIGDESKATNQAIVDFVRKIGEVAFQMQVSDPQFAFDLKRMGEKVQFNQYKFDSLDGFIKAGDECFIVLPAVHKAAAGGQLGEVVIKANVLPLNYEFP